jgi:hypothetical protein
LAKAEVISTSDRQLPERAAKASEAVSRHRGFVVEPGLAVAVQRLEQAALPALATSARADVAGDEGAHRRADREHGLRVDGLRPGLEQGIVEQRATRRLRAWWRKRPAAGRRGKAGEPESLLWKQLLPA